MVNFRVAIQGMTTAQKIATVVVAVLVPLGTWFGLGMETSKSALGLLGAAEIAAIASSVSAVFKLGQ